jgi:hypothetical protein
VFGNRGVGKAYQGHQLTDTPLSAPKGHKEAKASVVSQGFGYNNGVHRSIFSHLAKYIQGAPAGAAGSDVLMITLLPG